jgi:hydroxyacylglutathione hydrolase
VDDSSREALVIDPGDEPEKILVALANARAKPVALLHTHAHFDHIGGTREVRRVTEAPIRLHPADRFLYDALPQQAALFGVASEPPLPPDGEIADGDRVSFGSFAVRAIHTPGHTPGSTCYLLEEKEPILFSGDTLFRRSIGRTDLWGGDTAQILVSIRERLYALDPSTRVVCGHGPDTTIGEERKLNPFVRE